MERLSRWNSNVRFGLILWECRLTTRGIVEFPDILIMHDGPSRVPCSFTNAFLGAYGSFVFVCRWHRVPRPIPFVSCFLLSGHAFVSSDAIVWTAWTSKRFPRRTRCASLQPRTCKGKPMVGHRLGRPCENRSF